MSTKEQERKALKQILNIVDGLGDDSYIAIALDGCLQDAEANIENDWACSMKGRVESLEKEKEKLEWHVADLTEKLNAEMAEHSLVKRSLEKEFQRAENEHRLVLSERGEICELKAKVARLEGETHDRDITIMELKAKRYDLLVGKDG